MDDATKRMLLLGRQAPPKAIDLKLEPRTYVSPSHAPVADVSFRVEKHVPIDDPGNKAERKAKQEIKAKPVPTDDLEAFQNRVRMRAAKVHKQLKAKQQEQQAQHSTEPPTALQLQAKKESLNRRKAYAQRVLAANSEAFRRQKQAEEASSSDSDDSESSCDENSSSEAEEVVHTARAPSEPSTKSESVRIFQRQPGPATLQDPYNPPPVAKVVKGPCTEPPPIPSPPPQKKTIPAAARVKRQAVDASGIWKPAKGAQLDGISMYSAEEPCAPPPHVVAHVSAMKRQQELYRGAMHPTIASDDPPVGMHSLNEDGKPSHGPWQPHASQQSPPHYALNHQRMHPGAPGWGDPQQTPLSRGVLREEEYMTSPEMIALWQRQCEDLDAVREETRAKHTTFSGSEAAQHNIGIIGCPDQLGDPHLGIPDHDATGLQPPIPVEYPHMYPYSGPQGMCRQPIGRNLSSPTPSVASQPVLDREAGGGTGLAGKVLPAEFGPHWSSMTGPMQDRTNVPAAVNGLSNDQTVWSKFAGDASDCTDGRSDDELPLCGVFRPQRSGQKKGPQIAALSQPMLLKIQQRVDQLRLQLPQLCACHDIPVLDPNYTLHCQQDCHFYQNPERFSTMLKGLLETWGIIEPTGCPV